MTRQGIPLRPDRSFTHARALSTLVRSVIVAAAGKFNPATTSENFVREKWGAEEIREIPTVLRAASSPASPTQAGWAAELAQTSVALIAALQPPISAGAALLQRGLQIEFGRDAAIRLPAIAPGLCSFVAAGAPIPVQRFATSGPTMSPRKLACIIELTQEQVQSSSAESLVRTALLESVGKSLDAILFDDQPGDDVRPAGLRYGVAPLVPASPGEKLQAMSDDVIALGSAVGAVAGGGITYVAARPQALALAIRTLGTFAYAVLPSSALPSGMVLCIADTALAAAVGGVPRIDASRQAELQRETAPGQIATGGTMVTPVASVFQLDSIALRLVWEVSWMLRAPALAWVSGVNW